MARRQIEAKFRARFLQRLRTIPYSHFTRIEQQSLVGTADIIGHVGGYFVSIECKANNEARVSKLQVKNMNEIVTSGGIALVCSPENSDEVLSDLKCLQSASSYVQLQSKYSAIAQEMYSKLKEVSKIPFGHDESL